jgi:hypothetical protein
MSSATYSVIDPKVSPVAAPSPLSPLPPLTPWHDESSIHKVGTSRHAGGPEYSQIRGPTALTALLWTLVAP